MLNITRHEVVKDGTGKPTKLIIGVVYTDVNGKSAYRDREFSVRDFSASPTKQEIRDKVKQWLTDIPETGTSLLQMMKAETQDKETTTILKQGNPASLIGDVISEI